LSRTLTGFSPDYFLDELAVRAAYQAAPHQFNAIDTRSALKVHFWSPRPDPFDQEMMRRRARVTLFGEPAWITTAEDSILRKRVGNRITPSERQLGDAAGVVAVQQEKLDRAYLHKWAEQLGVSAELDSLLGGRIRPKHT
jgi:hypothetical protein